MKKQTSPQLLTPNQKPPKNAKVIQYELFDEQFNFFESIKRVQVASAGIQGGKTTVGAIKMSTEMAKFPNKKYLISAPTYKIMEQSTLPKFFEIAPWYKKYYKKGENIIELSEGGVVYIRSTEDPNKLEGMTIDGMAWMDEGGQMKRAAYINIQGRTAIAQAPILITTTPYALNWTYFEVYKQFKNGHNLNTIDVFEWESIKNPFFPKEEYERAKREMDPREFRRRYMAMWEKMSGLVYEDFTSSCIIEPKTILFKEVICGIDWGYTNPCGTVVIGIDKENTFYVIDEYYETNKTKEEIIERLNYYKGKYDVRLWYPDPEDPEALEQMKLKGLYPREVFKGKGSVKAGIDVVREIIRRGQLKVFSTCHNTLEEFGTYHYPEEIEDENQKEEPIKEYDHLMDALRYALLTYKPQVLALSNKNQFEQVMAVKLMKTQRKDFDKSATTIF